MFLVRGRCWVLLLLALRRRRTAGRRKEKGGVKWAIGFSILQLPRSPSGSAPASGLHSYSETPSPSNQCSHSVGDQLQRLARGKTQALGQSAGSENGPLGVAEFILGSRSYWILPQCQHLAIPGYSYPSLSRSGVQGDQSSLWAGCQSRKARISLSACHHGNMPALPPPKSSTIFPLNSGRQNGKGLLDQSIPAPPLVPSGETEAQEGRDWGGGGVLLIKGLPPTRPFLLAFLTSVSLEWSGRSKSPIAWGGGATHTYPHPSRDGAGGVPGT